MPGWSGYLTLAALSPQGVQSFVAEADWLKPEPGAKTGLKGSAILFGQDVPLFYWIFRRPWVAVRRWTGV